MGVHIHNDSTADTAILGCSTSGVTFGPIIRPIEAHGMDAWEAAEEFLRFLKKTDPRSLVPSDLLKAYAKFRTYTEDPLFNKDCENCADRYNGCWEDEETCSEECRYQLRKERYEEGLADYRMDRMKDEGF